MKKILLSFILTVSILASMFVTSDAAHPFEDVSENKWYAEAVDYCYNNGITFGTSETEFSPDMPLTRGMFILMLARMVDQTYSEYTELIFEDVDQESPWASAVSWAYENNITKGTSATTFSPDANITREQACTFFYNYLELKGIKCKFDNTLIEKYVDRSKMSPWAENGFIFAVSNGLVSSTSTVSYKLSPKMIVTRAQAVKLFMMFDKTLPKKYFTMSLDDGITQDLRIIEIFKKYNVDCCTFMVNTGLYGANWEWVGQLLGKPEVTHIRFTEEELRSGIYDGFDVQCHTRTHPSLKVYDDNPEMIAYEVQGNADDLADITGNMPVGLAWPGGDNEYTDKTIELVLENSCVRYARGINNSYNYKLPEYFMTWQPTCSIQDPNLFTYAQNFLNAETTEDMLFYVWGHGYEFDDRDLYDDLERLLKMLTQNGEVVLVTNTEFYELYKDEIPSWK